MEQLIQYLKQTVDDQVTIEKYNAKEKLSPYLAGGYVFYIMQLLDCRFFLVKPLEEKTIAQLKKQLCNIQAKLGSQVVILTEKMTPYKRKKYLAERIPFICEDNQMFLPFLGLHMQMKTQLIKEEANVEYFTPAMQLIYLWILYSDEVEWTQQNISIQLKVTTMTASRALDSFVKLGLLEYSIAGQTGRKKVYQCKDKKDYFVKGKEYLMNPVKKTFYVDTIPQSVSTYDSGLSALGQKTMLGDADHSIIAVYGDAVDKLMQNQTTKDKALEEHLYEVQEMKYDFTLLTRDQCSDPISIIYSLKEKDERIELAIDEMMEEFIWYVE